MRLTELGYLLVPLGLLFVVLGKTKFLLHLLAFFSPFTASTIAISEGSRFGMQPSIWIGILFIFNVLTKRALRPIVLAKPQLDFVLIIAMFWVFCAVTLLFPFVLEGLAGISPELINPAFVESEARLSGFQTYTLTQFLYLTFFLLISLCVMVEVRNFRESLVLIKTLITSAIVTALWGICVQYTSFFVGFDYPAWLLNNHAGYSQGFEDNLRILPRLTSVAPEASMFGYFLLMIIPLLLTLNQHGNYVYGRLYQKWVLLVLVVTALIGTSTTAYIGLLAVACILPISSWNAGKHTWVQIKVTVLIQLRNLAYALLTSGGLVMLVILVTPEIQLQDLLDVLSVVTVDKVSVGSGQDRLPAFQRGFEIFLETGGLGTGWGSNATFDLLSTLLANIGIVGLGLFIAMIALPLHHCRVVYRRIRSTQMAAPSLGLIHSILVGLLLMLLSIPGFMFTFFWVIFGLLLAQPQALARQLAPRSRTQRC